MKRHSLFCGGFWPLLFTFLIFLLLVVITIMFEWRNIEKDVLSNAKQDLESQGLDWASVDTFNLGRTVKINGIAPNQEDADKAVDIAKKAKGVHIVKFHQNNIAIAAKTPPYLNAIVTKDTIVLRGTVKNQETIDRLLGQASAVFGKENVFNKLSIGENTDEFADYNGLFQAIQGKGNSKEFSASFNENGLTLNGETVGAKDKTDIGRSMRDITGLTVNNNIHVILPEPVAVVVEPPKEDICLDLVNEVLTTGKINFATGKAVINQDSYELLKNLGEAASNCPDSKFIIAGHTDSTGNLNSNIALSKLRAQAVVDHLVNLGLSATQFNAAGYGPNQPIADNNTSEGRSQNRRIEFKLQTELNDTNLGEAE